MRKRGGAGLDRGVQTICKVNLAISLLFGRKGKKPAFWHLMSQGVSLSCKPFGMAPFKHERAETRNIKWLPQHQVMVLWKSQHHMAKLVITLGKFLWSDSLYQVSTGDKSSCLAWEKQQRAMRPNNLIENMPLYCEKKRSILALLLINISLLDLKSQN